MGKRIAAMVLNGLGFMNDRLYMFPTFLANKPVDRLFSGNLNAVMFNDDALGRCLDAVSAFGVTKLFSEISFEIGCKFKLFGRTARIDTTSLSVHGSYDSKGGEDGGGDAVFKITHGYSKDQRPDLKQMILNLATTGAGSFPIWMEAHSGNVSDKVILQQAAVRMQAFCDQLKDTPSFIFVGDSAMYEKCISENADKLLWLSRVPGTIKKALDIERIPDAEVAWNSTLAIFN
jgi:transposase